MNRSIFQYSQVDCPCFHFLSNPSPINSNHTHFSPNISLHSYRQERQSIKTGRSFQGKKSLRHFPKQENCKQFALRPNWTFDCHQQKQYGRIQSQRNKQSITFSYQTQNSSNFCKSNKISIFQQQLQKHKIGKQKQKTNTNIIQKQSFQQKQNILFQQKNTKTTKNQTKTAQKRSSISRFVILLNEPISKDSKQSQNFIETHNSKQKICDQKDIFDEIIGHKINLSALKASIQQLQSVYQDQTSAVQSTVLEKGKSTWVPQSKKQLGITQFISSLHIRSRRQSKNVEKDRRLSRLSPLIKTDEA